MKRQKIGLALGGGAARGMAHIGVLEILERENIPIDMVAGTSAGAVVGALLSQGKSAAEIKQLARDFDWKQRVQAVDLALPKNGFIAGNKIKRILKSVIGDVDFKDLNMPFACVATDINNGAEVVMNQGSVLEAVRASISIPVIFSVAEYNGRHLVDGGLVNPVPVSVLKAMGADFIIAVNVMPRLNHKTGFAHPSPSTVNKSSVNKGPNLFNILLKMFSITNSQVVEASMNGADVVIEPYLPGIGLGDFIHTEECFLQGGLATIDAVPEIKKLLAA